MAALASVTEVNWSVDCPVALYSSICSCCFLYALMLLVVETAVLYYCEENNWLARTFVIDNFLSFLLFRFRMAAFCVAVATTACRNFLPLVAVFFHR